MKSFLKAFKEFSFSGRVSNGDYWKFILITFAILIIPYILVLIPITSVDVVTIASYIQLALYIILVLPALSMQVKRLHDTGKSDGWIWLNLIPIIGSIIVFIFLVKDGDAFENKYGPVPTDVESNKNLNTESNPISAPATEELLNITNPTKEPKEKQNHKQNHLGKKNYKFALIFLIIALISSTGLNIYFATKYKQAKEKIELLDEINSELFDKIKAYNDIITKQNIEIKILKSDKPTRTGKIVPYGNS